MIPIVDEIKKWKKKTRELIRDYLERQYDPAIFYTVEVDDPPYYKDDKYQVDLTKDKPEDEKDHNYTITIYAK